MYTKPTMQRFGTFRALTQSTTTLGSTDGVFHFLAPVGSSR